MIYIETNEIYPNEVATNLGIKTKLSPNVEIVLGQLIFDHLEKVFPGTICDNSIGNFKMEFLNAEFTSSNVLGDNYVVDISLVHIIMRFLNSSLVTLEDEDALGMMEMEETPLTFHLTSLGLFEQSGHVITVIVD
ncbi:MAG: hypothetical protein DRJ10_01135 [Bacteroidetes bacterium]|nr:MAG: hypothetical protein DRJ10_01135 [Bacteroidota bacterium]